MNRLWFALALFLFQAQPQPQDRGSITGFIVTNMGQYTALPTSPASVTGGQESVGLRCPSHRIAQELLREFARTASGVVAAPSANKFGHVSPTTAAHVREEFGSGIYVLDGGGRSHYLFVS